MDFSVKCRSRDFLPARQKKDAAGSAGRFSRSLRRFSVHWAFLLLAQSHCVVSTNKGCSWCLLLAFERRSFYSFFRSSLYVSTSLCRLSSREIAQTLLSSNPLSVDWFAHASKKCNTLYRTLLRLPTSARRTMLLYCYSCRVYTGAS